MLVTVVDNYDNYDEFWIAPEYTQSVFDFLNSIPTYAKREEYNA